MPNERAVENHYTHGHLIEAIATALRASGKGPGQVTPEDLAPVDEFHIGGRRATGDLLDQLALDRAMTVLDVGSGIGGAARFTAQQYGCKVTGIDLTAEFVEAGQELCRWVGMDDAISLHQGSALAMPFADHSFDAAYMLHVGMNIADKPALMREAFRVLKPKAAFAIYDVMRTAEGELTFPVPWSETPATSALDTPDAYKSALRSAGFEVGPERSRRDFALAFFEDQRARLAAAGGPPPLGLHVLMGESRAAKIANMTANISSGLIAPVEIIARKP